VIRLGSVSLMADVEVIATCTSRRHAQHIHEARVRTGDPKSMERRCRSGAHRRPGSGGRNPLGDGCEPQPSAAFQGQAVDQVEADLTSDLARHQQDIEQSATLQLQYPSAAPCGEGAAGWPARLRFRTPTVIYFERRPGARAELHRPMINTWPFKRLFDIAVSATLLVALLPLFGLVALAIVIDSVGPVFYSQIRVGQNRRRGADRRGDRIPVRVDQRRHERRRILSEGRLFRIHKFRTMVVDAEKEIGPVWALKDDPRVTRVGKWLRVTRIDELPQLWNVLKGEMSLVGPRPERPHFVGDFADRIPDYTERLRALPGITGRAQVEGAYDACEEDVRNKLRYDLLYVRNCRLSEDLRILFRTVQVVVTRKGAH
jgi:lipopolysaccharide/colanic/teichoic acid biosynthesis glycosyltransferase